MNYHIPVTFQKSNSKDEPYTSKCEIVQGQASNEITIKSILPDERGALCRSESDRFGIPVLIDEDAIPRLVHQKIQAITIFEEWHEPSGLPKRTPYTTSAAAWLEYMSCTPISIELADGTTLHGQIEPRLKEERQQIKKKELLEELAKEKQKKEDANNLLAETLNKRVPIFSGVIQKLSTDEALFFMRLFAARFEMVNAQVYIKEDVPERVEKGKTLCGQVALIRKEMKIERWRLPYFAEIAREMGTSTANISQRCTRLFKKFPEVRHYYDETKNAFAAAFEKKRTFECLQEQISMQKDKDDKNEGEMDNPKLTKQLVSEYAAKQREISKNVE